MAELGVKISPTVESNLARARALADARRAADEKRIAAEGGAGGGKRPFTVEDVGGSPEMRSMLTAKAAADAQPPPPPRPEDPALMFPGFQGFTGDVAKVFAGALTRGGSDYVNSFMSGNPVEEERQAREGARARTGGVGTAASVTGDIAPYLLLPQSLFAGPAKAVLSGTATGIADKTARTYLEEGRLPSMKEIAIAAGLSGMFSVAGFYAGKFVQGAFGAKPTVTSDTAKALEDIQAKETSFTGALKNSRVILNKKYLKDMADGLQKRIMADRNMNSAFRSKDNGTYARAAMARLRELSNAHAPNPTYGYVSDMASVIRDSIRNSNYEVVARVPDEEMVNMIYKELDKYLETLPSTGKLSPKYSGGLGETINNYKALKDIHRLRQKTAVTHGVMKRAADKVRAGVPYDRALQAQFQQLMSPNIKGEMKAILNDFTPEELSAFHNIARGGEATYWLNILDHSFGHGVIGHFHRTYALMTRGATKGGAEEEARAAASLVNPAIPSVVPPQPLPSLGAMAGAAVGPERVPIEEERRKTNQ